MNLDMAMVPQTMSLDLVVVAMIQTVVVMTTKVVVVAEVVLVAVEVEVEAVGGIFNVRFVNAGDMMLQFAIIAILSAILFHNL
jgi:hypothetical protein